MYQLPPRPPEESLTWRLLPTISDSLLDLDYPLQTPKVADFTVCTMHSSFNIDFLSFVVAWTMGIFSPSRRLGESDHRDVSAATALKERIAIDPANMEKPPTNSPSRTLVDKIPQYAPDELTTETTSPVPTESYIHIPDLFSSIMAIDVRVNPHYAKVKREADARIARMMMKDEKWAAKNAKVDLAFLASAWCYSCDEKTLNLSMDWNRWVFLFDDRGYPGHPSGLRLTVKLNRVRRGTSHDR